MATVKKKQTRKMYVDPSPAIRIMGRMVVDHMKRRIHAGLDRDGVPFAPWSELYRMSREAAGYGGGTPGILTGGTVNSITLLGRKGSDLRAVLRFGPEGRAEAPARPEPWVFSEKKTPLARATAVADWQGAKKRKPKGIARNRLVWMLANLQRTGSGGRRKRVRLGKGSYTTVYTAPAPTGGTGRKTARKLLGITPTAREQIINALQRAGIFK
jgi:hypothetical protein